MNITVTYSCRVCGLNEVGVDVPARESEDVVAWMDRTVRLVAADHAWRSPDCRTDHLANLKVPLTGAAKIGGPAVQ